MWLLKKPNIKTANVDLDFALTYANGDVVYDLTKAERKCIDDLYVLYDSPLARPNDDLKKGPLRQSCLNALYSAYGEVQKKGRLKKLRRRLLNNAETCPFCGFAEPTQLDHHLPKSSYKALSIYSRNLVPSCGPCNNVKRAHVGSGDDELIHAYFDTLPKQNFLIAKVRMRGDALVVKFEIASAGIDPKLAARLKYQLERMELNSRYPKQINVFLFGQKTGMLEVYGSKGSLGLRKYLLKAAKALDVDFEQHDWRAAVMRGLADCERFCEQGVIRYFKRRRRRSR